MRKQVLQNRKKKRGKAILALGLAVSVLAGCAQEAASPEEETIELLEPVGVSLRYEEAAYRNLYNAEIFNAVLCPEVREYSYPEEQSFARYGALPGESVKSGDLLLQADYGDIDDQVKDLREQVEKLDHEYEKYCVDAQDDLNYAKWDEQEDKRTQELTKLARERLEEEMRERGELYTLDRQHLNDTINRLLRRKKTYQLLAQREGEVVSIGLFDLNENRKIGKGISAVAVGDPESLVLRSDLVSRSAVHKAEDLYAIIDGERYEVEYEELDTETYNRILKRDGVVYSTFRLSAGSEGLSVGTYGIIVLVSQAAEEVLCVPKDAVTRGDDGDYVWVCDPVTGETREAYVRTGRSDGMYVEVLSGVEEGDCVLSESALSSTADAKEEISTARLTMGSVAAEYSNSGYLFYPSSEYLYNTVEHGNVYLKEYNVVMYQQVTKGEVLATLEVQPESIEIERRTREIERERVRIEELRATLADLDPEIRSHLDRIRQTNRTIRDREEALQEKEKELKEYRAASGIISLKAPYDGIITGITWSKPGDLLYYKQGLVGIAKDTLSYLAVEDGGGQLSYGNEVTITYKDQEGQTREAVGTVATANARAVSKDLVSGYALIRVPEGALGEMAGSEQGAEGWWSRSSFDVKARIRDMDNVLLVPRRAVKESGGTTYVTVLDENGDRRRVSFVAGGSDRENYWCVMGLTEGMQVCLE